MTDNQKNNSDVRNAAILASGVEGCLTATDLIDHVQRMAYRRRFGQTEVQHHPSLDAVRQIIAASN